ncbi:hypothetical protein FBU59_000724 [Linderina macrospora]|uniref:Uncharacterized protein n=1 Tax=Linderina macrospora TaxID=4868 RepID=A0ACC1JG92_9FUNG|nr:hypothetical protein FBU59_000724 [Linderina macrospora]
MATLKQSTPPVSHKDATKRTKAVLAKLAKRSAPCPADDWVAFGAPYAGTSISEKLTSIYFLNRKLRLLKASTVAMAPVYSAQAKYLTIDSYVLYHMLRNLGYKSKGGGKAFTDQRHIHWPAFFNTSKHMRQLGGLKYFNYRVETDGVGASVSFFEWKLCRRRESNKDDEKKAAEKQEEVEMAEPELKKMEGVKRSFEFIGVDPGNKDVLTAVRLGDREWSCHLSNSQYHTESNFRLRALKIDRDFHRLGLKSWMTNTPNSHPISVAEIRNLLQHLYQSTEFLVHMNLHQRRNIRYQRWATYRRNRQVVADACHRVTKGLDRRCTVICVGGARFPTNIKGRSPSPRMNRFIDQWRSEGWRVVIVGEYNTSQLCSACHFYSGGDPRKLCGLGSSQDPFRSRAYVENDRFVRRCTNPNCRIVWNRDVNAARNIAYLGKLACLGKSRPVYFSSEIKNIPEPVVKQQSEREKRRLQRRNQQRRQERDPELRRQRREQQQQERSEQQTERFRREKERMSLQRREYRQRKSERMRLPPQQPQRSPEEFKEKQRRVQLANKLRKKEHQREVENREWERLEQHRRQKHFLREYGCLQHWHRHQRHWRQEELPMRLMCLQ